MVILPGCQCCGCVCQYPLTYSVASVEVVVESTGSDSYQSWASNMRDCQCSGTGGTYFRGEGWASYSPPSGTYSLSQFGNYSSVRIGGRDYAVAAEFRYSDGLIDFTAVLYGCYPGQSGNTFTLSGNTCKVASYFKFWESTPFFNACAFLPDYSTAARVGGSPVYQFSVNYSCENAAYYSSTSRLAPYSGFGYSFLSPSIIHNPTQDETYVEFGLSTWTYDPSTYKAQWQSTDAEYSIPGCGPAVITDGPTAGTLGTPVAAAVKISRVTVKYSDGTPDLDIL